MTREEHIKKLQELIDGKKEVAKPKKKKGGK